MLSSRLPHSDLGAQMERRAGLERGHGDSLTLGSEFRLCRADRVSNSSGKPLIVSLTHVVCIISCFRMFPLF